MGDHVLYSRDVISFKSDQEYVFEDIFNGRAYFKNKGGLQIHCNFTAFLLHLKFCEKVALLFETP